MQTIKDFLPLLRFSILKGGGILLYAIIWFIYLPFIIFILSLFLPDSWIDSFNSLSKLIPEEKFWLIPRQILMPLIWILGFVLFKEIFEEKIKYFKRNKNYEFTNLSWPKDWIFNGKTELVSASELHVKSSRAGCLLKTCLWRDFRMTFEMKFSDHPQKHVGIIFRAIDLDNYFMVEILQNSPHFQDKSGIKPHVRYRGGWELMEPEEKQFFNFLDYVKIILEVKGSNAFLYHKSKEDLIFKWVLPTHVDVNHIETGVKQVNSTTDQNRTIIGKEVAEGVQEIPFRQEYGMVGFRAHPDQGAIIKYLKVEPL